MKIIEDRSTSVTYLYLFKHHLIRSNKDSRNLSNYVDFKVMIDKKIGLQICILCRFYVKIFLSSHKYNRIHLYFDALCPGRDQGN